MPTGLCQIENRLDLYRPPWRTFETRDASIETEKIFHGSTSNKLPKAIQRTARRKLIYLDDAEDLQDLLAPPGNRLEKLKGDWAIQYQMFLPVTTQEQILGS